MSSERNIVEARNITRRYPGVLALDDVSITIRPGEVRAILGKNGAGKSTLIRTITGAETPDSGQIFIGGQCLDAAQGQRTSQAAHYGVRSVYQELSLFPEMSVSENLFAGRWLSGGIALDHRAMREKATEVIAALSFPLSPRDVVKNLGPAHRQLVEIARAMIDDPKLVILDEPTSSLSNEEVDLLFQAVRRIVERGAAVLYVSHRMKEIRTIAETATVLRDGRHIATFGIKDTRNDEVVKMMLGTGKSEVSAVPETPPPRDAVLSVRGLDIAGKVRGLDFDLYPGEILGIAGLLGSGRTEILRAIAGLDQPAKGEIIYHGRKLDGDFIKRLRQGLAITPENRKDDGIFPVLGVSENIVLADPAQVSQRGILNPASIRERAQKIVDQFRVKAAQLTTPIGTLSGGNQQKIVIGRWVYAGAQVLLLDEPTRGVDVEAKAQIYRIARDLAQEGKSIIFVSSEIEELPLVCNRVLVLNDGRFTETFQAPFIDSDSLLNSAIS